jgi:hypothetical protein
VYHIAGSSDESTGSRDREETPTTRFATFEQSYCRPRPHTLQRSRADQHQPQESPRCPQMRQSDSWKRARQGMQRTLKLNGGGS